MTLLVDGGGRTEVRGWTQLTTCTFTVLGTRVLDAVTHTLTRGPHEETVHVLRALVSAEGVDEPVDDGLQGRELVDELVLLCRTPNKSASLVVGSRESNFPLFLNLVVVVVLSSEERVSEAAENKFWRLSRLKLAIDALGRVSC